MLNQSEIFFDKNYIYIIRAGFIRQREQNFTKLIEVN